MILVTGANGHLGRRLMDALASTHPLRAVVRSERAAAMITTPGVEVRIVDYVDEAGMRDAASGCSHIVHLVGIIRETAGSTFASAHEETTTIVRRAAEAAGVGRIIYLSILGASADSRNDCLASKARAESILLTGDVPALILRVPMVLGEGDYASRALAARGRRRVCFQLRASSLEQPIYAGDVVAALVAGIEREATDSLALDLAGPESLSRRALTLRAAEILERRTVVVSLPLFLGMTVAWILERVSSHPPISRAMLGVLDHDDRIDPGPALKGLGISLTPLNEALSRCLMAA
jgi:uncharacterized protein YbjT (DUF2867 family)